MSLKTCDCMTEPKLIREYGLILRLLTHNGLFRQNCLILSEVVLYMERSKNHEKNYIITVQKNFTFLTRFDRKNTINICNIKKSNRQACFQMTLNARKSCANSFLKIKSMIIDLDFREINKTVKNSTAKPRNSSL